jgi:hypothetical protein
LRAAVEDRSSGVRETALRSLAELDRTGSRISIDPLRAISDLVDEATT